MRKDDKPRTLWGSQQKSKDDHQKDSDAYGQAFIKCCEAERQLDIQISIAGPFFEEPLVVFKNTITALVRSQADDKLEEAIQEVVAEIDAISQ